MPRRLPERPDGATTTPTAPQGSGASWTRHALAALTVGLLGLGTAGSIVLTGHAEQTASPLTTQDRPVAAVAAPTNTIHGPVPKAFRAERTTRSSFREALDETALSTSATSTASAAAAQDAADERSAKLDRQLSSVARQAKVLRKKQDAAEERAKAAVLPVARYTVAARFGDVGAWSRYHTGFDFSTSIGTIVRAPAQGVVTHAGAGGPAGGWAGTYITVKHDDGTSSLYAHLSSASVHEGEQVSAGQTIGRVGMSGRSFGPHLHFEIYPAGVALEDVYDAIDPVPWLKARGLNP